MVERLADARDQAAGADQNPTGAVDKPKAKNGQKKPEAVTTSITVGASFDKRFRPQVRIGGPKGIIIKNPWFEPVIWLVESVSYATDFAFQVLGEFAEQLDKLFLYTQEFEIKTGKRQGEIEKTTKGISGMAMISAIQFLMPVTLEPKPLAERMAIKPVKRGDEYEEIYPGWTDDLRQIAAVTQKIFLNDPRYKQMIDYLASYVTGGIVGFIASALASHVAHLAAGNENAFPSPRDRERKQEWLRQGLADALTAVTIGEVDAVQQAITRGDWQPPHPLSLSNPKTFGIVCYDGPGPEQISHLAKRPALALFRPRVGQPFLLLMALSNHGAKAFTNPALTEWDPEFAAALKPAEGFLGKEQQERIRQLRESRQTLTIPLDCSDEVLAMLLDGGLRQKRFLTTGRARNGSAVRPRDREKMTKRLEAYRLRRLGGDLKRDYAWGSPKLALDCREGKLTVNIPMKVGLDGRKPAMTYLGICPSLGGLIEYVLLDFEGNEVVDEGYFDGIGSIQDLHLKKSLRLYYDQRKGGWRGIGPWRKEMRRLTMYEVVDPIVECLADYHTAKTGFVTLVRSSATENTGDGGWNQVASACNWAEVQTDLETRLGILKLPVLQEVSIWYGVSQCAICGAKNPKETDANGKKVVIPKEKKKILFNLKENYFTCRDCLERMGDNYRGKYRRVSYNAAILAARSAYEAEQRRLEAEQKRLEKEAKEAAEKAAAK